jgi:hypothetical protein
MPFIKISHPEANAKVKETAINHRGAEKVLFVVEGLFPTTNNGRRTTNNGHFDAIIKEMGTHPGQVHVPR